MTDNPGSINDFKIQEAQPRRQYRLAALLVLFATLAVAALTFLLVREAQHATETSDAARRLEIANAELRAAKKERDSILLKYTAQLRQAADTSARPGVSPIVAKRAQVETALLSDEITSLIKAPNAVSGYSIDPPSPTISDRVQLLGFGAPSGWDTDVFWCQGPDAVTNYARARAAATVLAQAAGSRSAIAPGVRIGRLRLRPVRLEDRSAWPNGSYAVPDQGDGERQAADAIVRLLNRQTPTKFGIVPNINANALSKWYVSVFVCGS